MTMSLICLAFFLQIILSTSIRMQKVKLQTLDLESENYFSSKVWQHEGFFHPSVAQISEKLNISVNHTSTPNLLMSVGTSAILHTKLKNHRHTFLGIKFSAIIGKICNESKSSTTTSPTTTQTTSTTRKSVESIRPSILITTTMQPTTVQQQRLASLEVNQINVESENDSVVSPAVVKDDTSATNKNKENSKSEMKEDEKSEGKRGVSRRKRDVRFNSQELLEIQKIVKLAKHTVSEDKKADFIANTTLPMDSAFSTTTTESSLNNKSNSKPSEESSNNQTLHENATEDVKLSYKSWRASFDKSYRPPGFYLLVDNEVIFDNYVGVWYKPNVMGKTTPYSPKRLWNETEIQFQWDEPMDKEINVSFEWEPMDQHFYILIDKIELYTYGSQMTEEAISDLPKKSTEKMSVGVSGNGDASHNNVTVYIVLKSNTDAQVETSTTPAPQKNNITISSPNSEIVQNQTSAKLNADVKVIDTKTNESDKGTTEFPSNKFENQLLELIKIVKNLSDKGNKNETGDDKNKAKMNDTNRVNNKVNQTLTTVNNSTNNNNNNTKTPSNVKSLSEDKTALIILLIVIALSFAILVVLIYNKMKNHKNPNKNSARARIL